MRMTIAAALKRTRPVAWPRLPWLHPHLVISDLGETNNLSNMRSDQYSVDLVGVAKVTREVSELLDDLTTGVTDASTALDAALAVVAAEPRLSDALAAATTERRQLGLAAVARGGELVSAVQEGTLAYEQGDAQMAQTSAVTQAALPEVFPFRMTPR